ncbi:MAG: glycosyl transferase [Planctomycetes bacterium]|nr:glycosyl transferase [Planctomycetota bacterium]MBI3843737.1 glycosyl transferase [Planctomycetota bacterium]
MSDFYQTGVVSTLHRLGHPNAERLERLESELGRFTRTTPLGLLLPCLYSELDTPAMPAIVAELEKVRYLEEIVIALGQADRAGFERAKEFFAPLPQEKRILWIDGPRIQELFERFQENGINPGPDGKGRSAWLLFGYVIASARCKAVALHDCDILTYGREMLARLCYPVSNPSLGYDYAKGFYARHSDRFHGRVTRLFVSPLVRTLLKIVGYQPYLVFLDSFRYPLAGEFALSVDLARSVRIPGDWGLEVGFLGEVFRNCNVRHICEVDVCERYDHKHQALSGEDPQAGLMRMAVDIAKSLLRTLATEGIVLSQGFLVTLRAAYLRMAQDTVKKYSDDAAINGLVFDRHAESIAIEAFTRAIDIAGRDVLADPIAGSYLPNWNRVTSAIPEMPELLEHAVDEDNR